VAIKNFVEVAVCRGHQLTFLRISVAAAKGAPHPSGRIRCRPLLRLVRGGNRFRYNAAMIIRPATVQDVPAIAGLIGTYAQRGKMLFRSHAELYEAVRDFHVAEEPADGAGDAGTGHEPKIVGVCALEIVWADLAEVRSLAVAPAAQGRGLGKALVRGVIEEARRLRIHRVFALTYEQLFFEKLGFVVVEKAALPLKVWSVCIKCPKRDGCDEIAMVKTLEEHAPVIGDDPDAHEELRYEVPTPLVQLGRGRAE